MEGERKMTRRGYSRRLGVLPGDWKQFMIG